MVFGFPFLGGMALRGLWCVVVGGGSSTGRRLMGNIGVMGGGLEAPVFLVVLSEN